MADRNIQLPGATRQATIKVTDNAGHSHAWLFSGAGLVSYKKDNEWLANHITYPDQVTITCPDERAGPFLRRLVQSLNKLDVDSEGDSHDRFRTVGTTGGTDGTGGTGGTGGAGGAGDTGSTLRISFS